MSASIPLTDPLSLAWIQWCRNEHKPVATIASRTRALRSIGNAGTATREEVEAWWLTRAHLAPATRHNELANLRSFYRWAKRWEYRDDDPTLRLDNPRVDPGLPRPMTREDLHKAIDQLCRAPSCRPWNLSWGPDIRRAICLGAYAGLRISEAAALDWSDVDLESRQIRIMNSKNHKSRRVPISPMLLDALLPVDRDVRGAAVVLGDEILGLHEHPARAAARVIHPATRRFEDLDDHPHHAGRSEEFTAAPPFLAGEIAEEILVALPHQISRTMLALPAESHAVEQTHQLAQPALLDAVIQPGQRFGQRRVGGHQRVHRLVDEPPDITCCVVRQGIPSRRRWHHEGRAVGVGDVLEKYQPEDDVLVLAGRQRPA